MCITTDCMRRTSARGFTLVELMIVIAIIGILAIIAIPAYQDYSIRAQVSESLSLSSATKAAISNYYAQSGTWPKDNNEAGVAENSEIKGAYTKEMKVENNVIEIKFSKDAHKMIKDKKITLTAVDNDGSISWSCAGDGEFKPRHLPSICR
jgi:type IV pilus assembly protein PilA